MNTCKNCNVPLPEGETLCDNCKKGLDTRPKVTNDRLSVSDGFRFGLGFGMGITVFIVIYYVVAIMFGLPRV